MNGNMYCKESRVFSEKGTLLFPLLSKIIKFLEQFTAKLLSAYFPFIRKESRLLRSAFCVSASPFNISIFSNFAMKVMLLQATQILFFATPTTFAFKSQKQHFHVVHSKLTECTF